MTYIQICPSMSEFNAVKNKLATAVGTQYTPMYLKETNGDVQPSAVSEPSMLTNLESTTAAGIYAATPRPGVTGTLPVGNGGTGQTSLQATRKAMGLGDTTGALPVANGGTGATTAAGARKSLGLGDSNGNFPITVAQGGTGKATHTNNAVLTGNTTSAVNNVATANGALYATAANGAAKFGTLPVAQGGTGKATHTNNAVLTGNTTGVVKNVATASGALYATATNGEAKFGTLPVAQGGTGATKVEQISGGILTKVTGSNITLTDQIQELYVWGKVAFVNFYAEFTVKAADSTKLSFEVGDANTLYIPQGFQPTFVAIVNEMNGSAIRYEYTGIISFIQGKIYFAAGGALRTTYKYQIGSSFCYLIK